jgi:hypothetical protein
MLVLLTLRGMITTLPHDTALFKLGWTGLLPCCRGSRQPEPSDLYTIDRPLARSANGFALIVASLSSPRMLVPLGANRFTRIHVIKQVLLTLRWQDSSPQATYSRPHYTIQLSWLPSP